MKKIISILCLCAMLLGLVGCNKHTPQIYGFSDSGSGTYKVETEFNLPDDYVDKKAPITATVEFMGQQYTGDYVKTSYAFLSYYPWLYYNSENYSFQIKENGELCSLIIKNQQISISQEEVLPKSELIQIATNVAMQITDVTGWNVSIEPTSRSADGVFQEYYIFFVKCIDEIKTSEKITICLRSNGVLHAFASYMIGEFTEENVCGKFDYEEMKVKVIDRMDELCSSKDGNYNIVHDIEFVLTKETKNKVVLLVTDSRGRYDKDGNRVNGDYVKFIVR